MKKLVFLFTLLMLFVFSNTNINAQFSKQSAIDLVIDSIASDRIDSVNIYMEPQVLTSDYFIISPYDSLDSPYSNYWLVFIDEQPLYLWNHLCNYIFINQANGDYSIVNSNKPPIGHSKEFDSLHVSFEFATPSLDYSEQYIPLQVDDNSHYYAVLLTGYGQNNEPTFWNSLSHMYCALLEKGFPEENIYVLAGNGQKDSTVWGHESLNLNNDINANDILDVPCSVNNLDSIFQILEYNLSEDDLLFIYSATHGFRDTIVENKSHLILYNYEVLWDSTLAEMLENINCSQMIIPLFACRSGGFVDDLIIPTNNEKRTVITPVRWNRAYTRHAIFPNVYGMEIYPYFLITAFRGYHTLSPSAPWTRGEKIGEHPGDSCYMTFLNNDFHPDSLVNLGNEDGVIQIGEVLNYTSTFDPQFNSLGVVDYDCGFEEDLLSLTGISGHIDTTQTVTGNFIVGGDLTLNDSSTLIINDNSKFFFVNGDFHTQEESELIMEDSILFKNYQETDSIVISGDFEAGTGISFESIDSTTIILYFDNDDIEVEFSDCDFENVSLYGYIDTIIINSMSTFNNSRIRGADQIIIDSVNFEKSSISLMSPGLSSSNATITNCEFTLPHSDEHQIISLYRFATYYISKNEFANYSSNYAQGNSSITIEYSGTTAAINNISENVFRSDENGYSNTEGILIYASLADVINNDIQDQHVGVMFTGRCQSTLVGTSNFCNEDSQVIKNNNITQVYASEYSFPAKFIWNAIYHDTLTKCFVHHDINPNFQHDTVDVESNYWSRQHNPDSNLIPIGHFDYLPIYEPCSKSTTVLNDVIALYQSGVDQITNGNYSGAKSTFQEVINDYPKTEYANHAMKDILNLEPLTDNNYSSLKSYYLYEDSVIGNERLEKLGQSLANKCDEKLGNYSDAIDWYEDIIENPATLQDSVFAIIDLENCYLQMGIDTSLKSLSYVGRFPQYKQKTVKAHQDHRDELLALLLRHLDHNNSSDEEFINIESSKPAELLQNIPNPFKESTQITYKLKNESNVKLNIYNYNGQLIKTINEGFRPNGIHTTLIDASGLQSGIYFYSISINGHITDSKKMTLIN